MGQPNIRAIRGITLWPIIGIQKVRRHEEYFPYHADFRVSKGTR